MPTVDIVLPSPHPAQRAIEASRARFHIYRAGRRFGKDIEMQRRIIHKALKSKQPVAWFAPTYRMMVENWRQLRHILSPVAVRASDSEHRIDLVTGNALEMWSLDNQDAARGRKYGFVVINEAAMVKDLLSAWDMVIRPTLADYKGGADFGSTPRGLNGFYELWQRAEGNGDWARFHYTTYDNPYIDRGEIGELKASLPDRVFRQEIMADFLEDGSFFQGISEAAIIEQRDTPEQHKGHTLFMAADWGKSGDFSCFGVGCRECCRVVDWEHFNQIDYIYQRARLKSLYDRWHPRAVAPERNSMGEPNVEMLVRDGFPVLMGPDGKYGFYTSPTTKPPLIESLAQALILHGLKVPAEALGELLSFEVDILSSGYSKFGAPAGKHDDWVMMLALLWWAMTNARPHGGIHA